MTVIYTLLVAHFVADFICQSDWMATNKGKRWDALALHVGVYTAVVGLIVAFALPPSPYPYDSAVRFGVWVAVNATIRPRKPLWWPVTARTSAAWSRAVVSASGTRQRTWTTRAWAGTTGSGRRQTG